MARAQFKIHEWRLRGVLRRDVRYREYLAHVGREIRDAAIEVFMVENDKTNEAETSEFTPPKYLSSFRVRVYHSSLKVVIANTDPGWYLVEWGAHPGGDPTAFVLRYKPLTRGLTLVSVRKRW